MKSRIKKSGYLVCHRPTFPFLCQTQVPDSLKERAREKEVYRYNLERERERKMDREMEEETGHCDSVKSDNFVTITIST